MNNNHFRVAVIIPAYNEAANIAMVVSEINQTKLSPYQLTAVVVNDSSTDATAAIASKMDCILLDLPVNLGIGGAVQTGFKYAYSQKFDFALQLDGDGQHPAHEIQKLLEAQKAQAADVVIGSRFIDKNGFQSTLGRRMGIHFLKLWIKLYSGIKILDNTSGFRLYNSKALKTVAFHYPDEYPEPESIVLFAKLKFKIIETAVEMRERQGGTSSIRHLAQLYYMFKVSLAIFYSFLRQTPKNSKNI